MTKAGRYAGYALMAVTLLIGLGAKQGWIGDFGRVPAVAVAIITGALGVMLVFTDMMVRGLYTQAEILAQVQTEADGTDADRTGADGTDADSADGDRAEPEQVAAARGAADAAIPPR